ncbi:hypothetical protein [uncultured Ruegeria sp.]|uniref:hypothetical protein n=1 Tax=uncultured Ruegeria sp. TaxID=259304 RepID=UPI002627EDDD|nr:hypothetical protein [uncultured Ruegeria sp.]
MMIIALIQLENLCGAFMTENSIASTFDTKTRAKIRAALKAYMKAHRIGVPTLWDRVLKADPKKRDVSMPSMQRLIRGTHHSSEMLMEMSMQFLKAEGIELPSDLDDPLSGFASAFEGFLIPDDDQEAEQAKWDELGGRYQIDPAGIPPVVVTIRTTDGTNAIRVTEEHIIAAPDVITRYDGVMVKRERRLFGLLRNTLTYEPRVYWLSKSSQSSGDDDRMALSGHVQEQPFRLTAAAAKGGLVQEIAIVKMEAQS